VLARKCESKKDKMNENFITSLEEELTDICRADGVVRKTGPGEKRRAGLGA
jgi:hypothetical protein